MALRINVPLNDDTERDFPTPRTPLLPNMQVLITAMKSAPIPVVSVSQEGKEVSPVESMVSVDTILRKQQELFVSTVKVAAFTLRVPTSPDQPLSLVMSMVLG